MLKSTSGRGLKRSPFARVNELHEAASTPPGIGFVYAPADSISMKDLEDGLRNQYDAPEAVQGFCLPAYRPCSLPLGMTAPRDAVTDADCLAPQSSAYDWPNEDDAESICTPKISRTDVPLTYFLPPRNITSIRRSSMDSVVPPTSFADKISLTARSASAPAFSFQLTIEDLWAQTPAAPAPNPFDNYEDHDGLFKP